MNINKLLLLALYCIGRPLAAQVSTLEGRVINAKTNAPVPYATVAVPGQSVGTVADSLGRFTLKLAPATGQLVASCVGFAKRDVQLTGGQLVGGPQIALEPLAQALAAVTVQHAKLKPSTLGRRARHDAVIGKNDADLMGHWINGDDAGWEGGALYHFSRLSYLEEFHVYVGSNPCGMIRFRLNFYAVENGRPAQSLFTDDIQFVLHDRQTGWVTVDLRQYNLSVAKQQTIAATIQWLASEQCAPKYPPFGVTVSYPSFHQAVIRQKSEDPWLVNGAFPSMYFTLQQE